MRTRLVSATGLILATMLLITAAGCGAKDAKSTDLGLDPGAEKGGSVAQGGSSATSQSANPKSATGAEATSPASGGTTGGTTGGTSGGTTGGSTTGSKAENGKTKTIKILWWNDSVSKQPRNAEIVFGGKTYKPRAGKSATLAIGPCNVGKDLEMVIYPDGRSGSKLTVRFIVGASMISNSDQDAIHVEVRDDAVRVLGNPIPNFEQGFTRK